MYALMYFVWARNARARVCVRVSARVTHAILKIPYFFRSEFFLDFFLSGNEQKKKISIVSRSSDALFHFKMILSIFPRLFSTKID